MNKKDLELLERAFDAEIGAALEGAPRTMQTRAKARADRLVEEGYLRKFTERFGMVTIEGYELTHAGRFTYCATCEDEA